MGPLTVGHIDSNIYKKHEESARRALALKRKELKWKLMSASQIQNQAKLEEVRIETDYNKQRMMKISNLAHRLRAKYIKACKAARNAELTYKQSEEKFLDREKSVAEEKMQLTKLAVDCRKLGMQLYGPEYKLSTSPSKWRKVCLTRLSSLYDLRNSLLKNLASYRLTSRFHETCAAMTDLRYAHNICPHIDICTADLNGTCNDKNCPDQHDSSYLMTDVERLADILSYRPSLIGFKVEPDLNKEENENNCRLKLKQYAARLLAKNSDKSIEVIAQNLVKYVRTNKSDLDLLVATRKIPKLKNTRNDS